VRSAADVLANCKHTVSDVQDCIARTRTALGTADEKLAAYRAVARAADAKDAAEAFARRCDLAIGKLRRSVVAFSSAAQAAGMGASEDSLANDPFPPAVATLKDATSALEAAEAALPGAPR
jgi:hypothetical protein